MGKTIEDVVREKYGAVAAGGLSSRDAGVKAVAEAFGYTAEELDSIPAEANMGLSCGNPTATANLRPGEVVVDLGSGGGLDVFLAARKVGPAGRAVGIDMTPEMVERARAAAARQGLANVEFHLATIDKLPLPDASADCVISNCVINLAPDKPAVFREIFRVLKPGGRVAVSDIALKKELPPEVSSDLLAYVGCVAGAIPIAEYVAGLQAAGFAAVQVVDAGKDLNAYSRIEGQSGCCTPAAEQAAPAESECCTPAPEGSSACCTPKADAKPVASGCCTPAPAGSSACCTMTAPPGATVHGSLAELLARYDVNEYAASVRVYAVKGA
jgi:ubiquinone/menaquinone biosynthesis C-methylase UbiE